MLMIPSRIFLCNDPVSMHKSFEGLSYLVEQLFPGELLSGALFVFFNRQRTCIKALTWDRDGFTIFYKRLEKGCFSRNTQNNTLDQRGFLMLWEGIESVKMRPQFSPKKE